MEPCLKSRFVAEAPTARSHALANLITNRFGRSLEAGDGTSETPGNDNPVAISLSGSKVQPDRNLSLNSPNASFVAGDKAQGLARR